MNKGKMFCYVLFAIFKDKMFCYVLFVHEGLVLFREMVL
jgi:hypothetical protein